MLRTKFFKLFAALIVIFGVLSSLIGIRMIKSQVIGEAQKRVHLDLESAWALYHAKLREMEIILKLAADKKTVVEACEAGQWNSEDLVQRSDAVRRNFGLDYLGIVSTGGVVMLRSSPPHNRGDSKMDQPVIARALAGEAASGAVLLNPDQLNEESDGLAGQALLPIEETPRARRDGRAKETRGLVLLAAAPVVKDRQILGAVFGGVLLNRNYELVDGIKNVVFKDEIYQGMPLGTATIFLDDCRVSTTVLTKNGQRAIGTRASREVAERVLDQGGSWVGRAFVVHDWYLTAYDPIKDDGGRIVGMLYVGILEKPFKDLERNFVFRYAGLLVFGLLLSLGLAYFMAARVAAPIHRIVLAAHALEKGEPPHPVAPTGVCEETDKLTEVFNGMARALVERESTLKTSNADLERANIALRALNQSYMNVVGFVSHELQGPVATLTNYVYALRQGTLGPLTESQEKVIRQIEHVGGQMTEMVRHYLNLSRIENGELQPNLVQVSVLEDILAPLLEAYGPDIKARGLKLENEIPPGILLDADWNMTREVFENLISNAVKYSREGGRITLNCRAMEAMMEFAIRNEGLGIPPDKRGKVFQKFVRFEPAKSGRRQKGTGLGLFITKHIIEAHKGTISVVSDYGQWAEFRFTLPRKTGALGIHGGARLGSS